MKQIEKVQSTVRPSGRIGFDQNHVYVYSNVKEVPEEERTDLDNREETEVPTLYEYSVEEYEKDEFLSALSTGQLDITDRQNILEEAILEMSEAVYA